MNEEQEKKEKTDEVAACGDCADCAGSCETCEGGVCPPADEKKPAPTQGQFRRLLKSFGLGIFIAVAVIGIVTVGILTYGGYKKGWGGASIAVMRGLSLPAATVNGNVVKFGDYVDDLQTARYFFAKAKEQDPTATLPSDAELKQGVLDRLIENEIVNEEARRLNVSVTDDDLEAEFQVLAASSGDMDPAQQIYELYGWTVEEFKEKVMRPFLLEQKITAALAEDPSFSGEAEAEAKSLLERVRAGEDFATLASENSDDPGSAMNGGELGFFARGLMVGEFEEAAFVLNPGEVSDLVKTSFGYHIIKVTDVKKGEGGEVSEVEASHILIALPDAQTYIAGKLNDAKIVRYVDVGEVEK